MAYSKDSVDFHCKDNYGPRVPAVNVKVRNNWYSREVAEAVERDEGAAGFGSWYEAWTDANDEAYWPFEFACEQGWEQLQELAEEVWGAQTEAPNGRAWGTYAYIYKVKVYSTGRSGGWAYVDGLPDFEEWDAVMLAKWRRFERIARMIADGIPYDMASLVYINVFEREEAERLTGPSRDVALIGAGL